MLRDCNRFLQKELATPKVEVGPGNSEKRNETVEDQVSSELGMSSCIMACSSPSMPLEF